MIRSEATSPEADGLGPGERLHPLFLLSGLGGSLRGLAGGYAVIGYLAISGRLETALYGIVALIIVSAIGILLYWRRFEYRVGASEIRIDSGIVSRRHRSIPFDRIQDVDISQGLLARVLGLATVKFETGAAGSGPNAEEAVLHAVTLRRAQEIRRLVRGGRAALIPVEADATEARPPIYALGVQRLVLAGTFNFSLAVFAGLFGLSQTVGDVVGFDPLNRRFWSGLAEGSEPIMQFLFAHRSGAAAAGVLLLLVIGTATGVVRTVLRDFGFRLDATEAGLRRRRGLLTRTDVTLPVKRAQAVVIGTGPIRQAFGWYDLHVQSLAQDEGGRGDHILAPLATEEDLGAILAALGWRPVAADQPWTSVSKAYVTALALGLAPLGLLALAEAGAFAYAAATLRGSGAIQPLAALLGGFIVALGVLAAILVALPARWLAWRRTAYALDGDRLLIRSGWFRRRTVILPAGKIQSIDLTQNALSRWLGVAALRFGVAGGRGFARHYIPAIPTETARQLRDELLVSVP